MTYKAAVTLDGRVTVPGARWVTGEESRRLVHELRAAVDAVAVGMGTARADLPRLDARDVETPRGQPRRLVFSARARCRTGSTSSFEPARSRRSSALAAEGVQSLLLEGGPTLARRSSRRTWSTSSSSSSRRSSPAAGPALAALATIPAPLSHLSHAAGR